MANKEVKIWNRSYKSRHSTNKRVPTQPPGEPQGTHLQGFKGTKVDDANCRCGRCNARKS